MLDVLVTMRFNEAQLERLRRASPDLRVTCADTARADYAAVDVLYAGAPPRDLGQAPRLKWVQLHMAGVNALHDHPLYTTSAIPLTTTSGCTRRRSPSTRSPCCWRWLTASRGWWSGRPGASGRPTSSAGRCSCRRKSAGPRSASSATAASAASWRGSPGPRSG